MQTKRETQPIKVKQKKWPKLTTFFRHEKNVVGRLVQKFC